MKFCDKTDCPKHPEYVEYNYDYQQFSFVDGTIKINISDDITLPLECLACIHFKKIDIRQALLIEKAKKLLSK